MTGKILFFKRSALNGEEFKLDKTTIYRLNLIISDIYRDCEYLHTSIFEKCKLNSGNSYMYFYR